MEGGADVLESLGDGKRVLCLGPPMTGKREFLLDLVRGAAPLGREALVVTTDTSASALLDRHPKSFEPGHAGVVDCTGADLPDRDLVLESVPSPADLTGVAVAVSKALQRIGRRSGGLHRPLVGVDSLATLSLYAEFDRLFRFVHTFGGQVTDRDGLFFATLDSDSLDPQSATRIQSTADGRIEFRNRTEYRLVGLGTGPGEWIESSKGGSVDVDLGGGDAGAVPPDAGPSAGSGDEPGDSGRLASFVERILADGPTLTLCNVDDETDTGAVDSHFGRLNVPVRRASFDVDAPRDVALLHDGDDLLAASPLPAVRSALDAVEPESESIAVLEAVPQELFAAEAADRRTLVRASRTIERLAAGGSGGDLHAGFQEVSRLLDDPETRAVYDRLDETDVTVHLYGEPDADLPDWEGVVAHGLPDPELADAWFVVYESPDGAASRGGALVTLEGEPGAYDGFWSYDPEVVSETRSFVESTYLGREGLS
jgi:KaiC/GvpD/RAD55 family RecA-like ATPase